MTEENSKITIKNKIEQNWIVIILLSFWITGVFFILGSIIISTILDFKKRGINFEIFICLIPFLLFKLKAIQILLWNYKGVEQITINNKELIIERQGTIFFKPKKYNLLDITNIKLTDNKPFSWFYRYNWNTNDGKVAFKFMEQDKQMGIELKNKDASYITELLKEKVAFAKIEQNIVDV